MPEPSQDSIALCDTVNGAHVERVTCNSSSSSNTTNNTNINNNSDRRGQSVLDGEDILTRLLSLDQCAVQLKRYLNRKSLAILILAVSKRYLYACRLLKLPYSHPLFVRHEHHEPDSELRRLIDSKIAHFEVDIADVWQAKCQIIGKDDLNTKEGLIVGSLDGKDIVKTVNIHTAEREKRPLFINGFNLEENKTECMSVFMDTNRVRSLDLATCKVKASTISDSSVLELLWLNEVCLLPDSEKAPDGLHLRLPHVRALSVTYTKNGGKRIEICAPRLTFLRLHDESALEKHLILFVSVAMKTLRRAELDPIRYEDWRDTLVKIEYCRLEHLTLHLLQPEKVDDHEESVPIVVPKSLKCFYLKASLKGLSSKLEMYVQGQLDYFKFKNLDDNSGLLNFSPASTHGHAVPIRAITLKLPAASVTNLVCQLEQLLPQLAMTQHIHIVRYEHGTTYFWPAVPNAEKIADSRMESACLDLSCKAALLSAVNCIYRQFQMCQIHRKEFNPNTTAESNRRVYERLYGLGESDEDYKDVVETILRHLSKLASSNLKTVLMLDTFFCLNTPSAGQFKIVRVVDTPYDEVMAILRRHYI